MDLSKLVGLTLRNKTRKNRGKLIKKPLDNILDISFNPSNKKDKNRPVSKISIQWRDSSQNSILPLQEGNNSGVASHTGRLRASKMQSEASYYSSSSVNLNHGRCHRHEAINTNTEVNEGKNFCDVLGENFCKECTKERRRMDFAHDCNIGFLSEQLSNMDQRSCLRTVTSYSDSFIGGKPLSATFSSTAREVFCRLHNFGSGSAEYFINPFQGLDSPSTGNSDSDSTACTPTHSDTSCDSISVTEVDASLERKETHPTKDDCERTRRKKVASSKNTEKRNRVSSAESSDGIFARRDKTHCKSKPRIAFEVEGNYMMEPPFLSDLKTNSANKKGFSSGETSNKAKIFPGRKTQIASEFDANQMRYLLPSDCNARKSTWASTRKGLRVSSAANSDTSTSSKGRRARRRKPRSEFENGTREKAPSVYDEPKLATNTAESLEHSTVLPSDKTSNNKGRRTRTRKDQAKNLNKGKRTKIKMSEAYNKLPIAPPLVTVALAKLVMDSRRVIQAHTHAP